MAWIATGINAVGGILQAGAQRKAAKLADRRLQEGRDYAINKSGLGSYASAGTAASDRQAALLGLGGDQAAAEEAFNNYLSSTGYQANLKSGTNAINSSAAARGLLNSGATLKATQRFGQELGSQYFNNYLGQVGNVANRGLSASSDLAHTVTGVAGGQANVQQNLGNAQSDIIGNVFGTAADVAAYKAGQLPPGTGYGGAIKNIFGTP